MSRPIVVVGSINVDQVVTVPRHPHPGETLAGSDPVYLPGGKGANQAVAAALQGASVTMIGAVGRDSDPALDHLRSSGVDLSHVAHTDGTTGLAVITVAQDGENTIVVTAGANATVDASRVEQETAVIRAAAICVLQAEIPADGTDTAARIARDGGVRVVYNPSPLAAFSLETLRCADPLVVNEHEAAEVLRQLGGSQPAPAGTALETALALARALVAAGTISAVVTAGGEGAAGAGSDGAAWTTPGLAVTPVDTTGAGDGFLGALAARLAEGDSLERAAAHATRVAAFSVQRHGTQPSYPGPADALPGS